MPAPARSCVPFIGPLRGSRRTCRRGGADAGRFVGREQESALLERLAAQALAGTGQVVSIVGEPGMGKSRLLYEFTRAIGATDRTP